MKLEIGYRELSGVISVLDKLKLNGLKSVHKTRLARQLREHLDRIAEEQLEIQKDYFELDEDDMPIVKNETCKDIKGYNEEINKFLDEKVVIDSGDSQVMLKSIKNSLEESDVEWENRDAYSHEYLYTALEKGDQSKDIAEDPESEEK
jgi:hypothetical protein